MSETRTTSTIGPARAALYRMLSNDEGLAGVQVVFGNPDSYEEERVVALGGVRDPEESAAMVNRDLRKEVFTLELRCKSHMPAEADPIVVEEDGLYLAERVRAVVLADGTLDGTVNTAHPSAVTSNPTYPGLTVQADGGGYACLPLVLVTCTSWIRRPEG